MEGKPKRPMSPPVRRLAVDLSEAARLISIGRTLLYSLVAEGKGPPVIRLHGRRVVRVSALEEWLRHQESKDDDR